MPNPNRSLPPLNPLAARSTVAAILAFVALIGPLLGGGLGEMLAEIAANGDMIRDRNFCQWPSAPQTTPSGLS